MVLPIMSICLAQRLIAPYPSNTMFHDNPPPREGSIERDILGRPIFTARFAARGCAQTFGVQFVDAHVGQIADAAHAFGQPREQSRLLQHADIGGRATTLSATSTIWP